MHSRVITAAVEGLSGYIVDVEVDISPGLPRFNIVGLVDVAVNESKERVRAAIRNSGGDFPNKRITVSLAPADIKKSGTYFDLPIALGILCCTGQIRPELVNGHILLGELALDGQIRAMRGILPIILEAQKSNIEKALVPEANKHEAAIINDVTIFPIRSLRQLLDIGSENRELTSYENKFIQAKIIPANKLIPDIADVRGQESAKRCIEIAAAGGHNLLMSGSPGVGKTMLLRCLSGILPKMTKEESIEVTSIYSIAGMLKGEQLIIDRPFRAPHYNISSAGLIGGGNQVRPGEITLSHRGILFLDELSEFNHSILELLRQPLEDKIITLSRARGSYTFPANFTLVAATNPCPCGYYLDKVRECTCTPFMINRYQKRLSGPLLDRFDMFVTVNSVKFDSLITTDSSNSETTDVVQAKVEKARKIQAERYKSKPHIKTNSNVEVASLQSQNFVSKEIIQLLKLVVENMKLSARGYHKVLKVARTCADLDDALNIEKEHIMEALSYRRHNEIIK